MMMSRTTTSSRGSCGGRGEFIVDSPHSAEARKDAWLAQKEHYWVVVVVFTIILHHFRLIRQAHIPRLKI